jgi:prepilin-type N-terminal cleavage/methylation domain-containing protein
MRMRARESQRASARRGFTLIEVVVALSAGLLVTLAAFMLSKNATAFFQHEARVSTAQLGLNLAMNRLTGDIQRAALNSSPNASADPNVCRTGVVWPTGLQNLAGITVVKGTTPTTEGLLQTPNPMPAPDSIIIGGSLDSTEVYQVQSVTAPTGGSVLLTMRGPTGDPATARALAAVNGTVATIATDLPCKLKPVFAPSTYPPTGPQPPTCAPPIQSGRFGHLYHPESNTHWFGVIDSFTVDANGIKVTLDTTKVPIPTKPSVKCGLGVGDTGGGWMFSVVSRVRYEIMSLVGAGQFDALVKASTPAAVVAGDTNRTELVRRELDANDAPLDWTTNTNTTELVAEYAVDMRFGFTAVTQPVIADNYNPVVQSYAVDDNTAGKYQIVDRPSNAGTPQWVRGVQVRLAVRTRAPDRDTDIPQAPGADSRRLRWRLFTDPLVHPSYARVRTLYAFVSLPNQGGFSLW